MVVLILIVPLSWMPGFFIFFTRKGKTGRRTAKSKKDNNNETQPFGKHGDKSNTIYTFVGFAANCEFPEVSENTGV